MSASPLSSALSVPNTAARPPLRVGLIGFGAIGRVLLREWTARAPDRIDAVTILVRKPAALRDGLPNDVRDRVAPRLTADPAALLARRPELIVECAGHGAVDAYGEPVLAAGIDLMLASVGALADDARLDRLRQAAARGGSRLIIPAGAIGGLDWLAAAEGAGLEEVVYRSRKPPAAWAGSLAEQRVSLAGLTTAETFFTGSAREAARDYPKNANVAATVALATVGFDATRVELIADPSAPGNVHEIEARGRTGRLQLRIEGRPDPDNPRTSAQTAYSLARNVINRTGWLVL